MNILLIDDHPLVRKGLISVLSLENDIDSIREASNIKDAYELITYENPDIILIDLKLGKECGLEVIEMCNLDICNSKFIVLTSSTDEGDFKKAKELCVHGYVLKEALPEELIYAIRLVYKGRKYYDPKIMDEIMNEYNEDNLLDELTVRELEVLTALSEGLNNKDIADKLFISIFTVKKHISQILNKLNLTDRTQAALFAQSKMQRIG